MVRRQGGLDAVASGCRSAPRCRCHNVNFMTCIGSSIRIRGEITSEEDIELNGELVGCILVRKGAVHVGRDGRANADIRGVRVTIAGSVRGAVSATERIELTDTARVNGSLSADRVVLIEGATFNGRIDMDRRTIAAKLARYRRANARSPIPDPTSRTN